MNNEYRLTYKQILVRLVSVAIAGIGIAGCIYSLSLQIYEVGATVASLIWFSSLGAAVLGIAGYASSCDPGKGKSFVAPAAVCILAIGVAGFLLEKQYLYDMQVIEVSLVAILLQAAVLVAFHFMLKHDDPDAA